MLVLFKDVMEGDDDEDGKEVREEDEEIENKNWLIMGHRLI
jgi:hypothetical protein